MKHNTYTDITLQIGKSKMSVDVRVAFRDVIADEVRRGKIEVLEGLKVNPYYPGGPSEEHACVYVSQIDKTIAELREPDPYDSIIESPRTPDEIEHNRKVRGK